MNRNALAYVFGGLVVATLVVLVLRGGGTGEERDVGRGPVAGAEFREPVGESDLPAPVAAAMRSHPRAIYVSGVKVTRGDDVEYRLTLRGTRKTAMVVRPDGTVVSFE